MGPMAVLLVAAAEELSQVWFPLRCVDPWDLVADVVGIAVGFGAASLGQHRGRWRNLVGEAIVQKGRYR